jgi:hypothetical protein
MQEFGAYLPFLQKIITEYDSLLDIYASKLHYIAPLKARLATIKEDATVQLRQIKMQKQSEIDQMQQYAAELLQNRQQEKVRYSLLLFAPGRIENGELGRAKPRVKKKTLLACEPKSRL